MDARSARREGSERLQRAVSRPPRSASPVRYLPRGLHRPLLAATTGARHVQMRRGSMRRSALDLAPFTADAPVNERSDESGAWAGRSRVRRDEPVGATASPIA